MERLLTDSEIAARVSVEAEKAVQRILLDLEERTGQRVDFMRIDTREFGNCYVEIFLR